MEQENTNVNADQTGKETSGKAIGVYLMPQEYVIIVGLAKNEGKSVSSYARRLLIEALKNKQ